MDKETALRDLQEITTIIDRSKRYTAISGISIIISGVIALLGLFISNGILKGEFGNFTDGERHLLNMYVYAIVLLLSLVVITILSSVKSLKHGEKVLNDKAMKCFMAFIYPILTGGVISILGYWNHQTQLIPSVQLIFYGLACIAGSPHSFKEFKLLGIFSLVLGIVSLEFLPYNLFFWGVGFGLGNIGYGLYIHFKYEK